MLRFTKLAKLTRVIRAVAFLEILRHKLNIILKTNGFIYVLYANISLIFISSVVMVFAENQSLSDALWWSIVTCTTVGYGDIAPSTAIGRIVAIILMVFGIGLIGTLTSAITTYFTSKRQNIYNGENATANIGNASNERSDSDAHELLEMIESLSIVQKAEIILKINEMLNEK